MISEEKTVKVLSHNDFTRVLEQSRIFRIFQALSFDSGYTRRYLNWNGTQLNGVDGHYDMHLLSTFDELEGETLESTVLAMIMGKMKLPGELETGKIPQSLREDFVKAMTVACLWYNLTKSWPLYHYEHTIQMWAAEVRQNVDTFSSHNLASNYLMGPWKTNHARSFLSVAGLSGDRDLPFFRALWNFSRLTATEFVVPFDSTNTFMSTASTPPYDLNWFEHCKPFEPFMHAFRVCEAELEKSNKSQLAMRLRLFADDCRQVMACIYSNQRQKYYELYRTRFDACVKSGLPFVFPLIVWTSGHSSSALMIPDGALLSLGLLVNGAACFYTRKSKQRDHYLSQAEFLDAFWCLDNVSDAGIERYYRFEQNIPITDLPQKAPNCMHRTFYNLFRLFCHHFRCMDMTRVFKRVVVSDGLQHLNTVTVPKVPAISVPYFVIKAALSSPGIHHALQTVAADLLRQGRINDEQLLNAVVESEIVRNIRLRLCSRYKDRLQNQPAYLKGYLDCIDDSRFTVANKLLFSAILNPHSPIDDTLLNQFVGDTAMVKFRSEKLVNGVNGILDRHRMNMFEILAVLNAGMTEQQLTMLFNSVYPTLSVYLAQPPAYLPELNEPCMLLSILDALANPCDAVKTIDLLDQFWPTINTLGLDADFDENKLAAMNVNYEPLYSLSLPKALMWMGLVWRRLAMPHLLLATYRACQKCAPTGSTWKLSLPLLGEPNQVLTNAEKVADISDADMGRFWKVCRNLSAVLAKQDTVDAKIWQDVDTFVQLFDAHSNNPDDGLCFADTDMLGRPVEDLFVTMG